MIKKVTGKGEITIKEIDLLETMGYSNSTQNRLKLRQNIIELSLIPLTLEERREDGLKINKYCNLLDLKICTDPGHSVMYIVKNNLYSKKKSWISLETFKILKKD